MSKRYVVKYNADTGRDSYMGGGDDGEEEWVSSIDDAVVFTNFTDVLQKMLRRCQALHSKYGEGAHMGAYKLQVVTVERRWVAGKVV